jgi:hypothetical protein
VQGEIGREIQNTRFGFAKYTKKSKSKEQLKRE